MKNILQLLRIILLIVITISSSSFGQTATPPSNGDGTQGNPWQIATLDNLYWLSQTSSEWASGKYFVQTADIDASSTSSWDGGNGFSPIGNDSNPFSGTYNGNMHTISNLLIDRNIDNVGLFGDVSQGTINNLGVVESNFTGHDNTGGIVGRTHSWANIEDVYFTGSISGNNYVGGIVGQSYNSHIMKSYSSCNINGNQYLGGLVGFAYNSTLQNCYSKGEVTGSATNYIAAFCGLVTSTSSVQYCYTTGNVNLSGITNRGFIASLSNEVTYKSNFFDSTASNQLTDVSGAATAKITEDMQNTATFTNLSSSDSWDFISNPNNDQNNNDDWGINPTENNGYPFLSWQNYTNYLDKPSSGDGTTGNPYSIETVQDLYWISQNPIVWNKEFIQSNNIDLSATNTWNPNTSGEYFGFAPIGNDSVQFSGVYNGNNKTIDNLFINRERNKTGLFGYVINGVIKNLGVTNVDVEGNDYCGALIGLLAGSSTINNTFSTGTVIGNAHVGGLNGDSDNATIISSYSLCSVNGTDKLGGLVGNAGKSTIQNCYSRGLVKAFTGTPSAIGGFCGESGITTIEHCYSTGQVVFKHATSPTDKGFVGALSASNNTFTSNFFDSETSQQSSDAGGAATAKTSSEMKDYTTFTVAGWDFVSETDNGSDDYWDADQNTTVNDGYVILSWQSGADNTLPVELTTFSANIVKNKIQLNWQTATEVNNYGFEIQRQNQVSSIENKDPKWQSIAFVEGHGNSNSPRHYSFIDNNINSGKYFYRLKQIDINGSFEYSKEIEVTINAPNKFQLAHNYPNPFNPTTTINYSIPDISSLQNVQLKVYNILGKEVATLVNKEQSPGNYKVSFNANNLTSGIYYYKLSTNNFTDVKQMILLK